MASVIAQFFAVTGIDTAPPSTMAELIPYLVTILIGVALVSGVFLVIGKLLTAVFNFRRW